MSKHVHLDPDQLACVLAEHSAIADAAVTVQPGRDGQPRLVGYVVPRPVLPDDLAHRPRLVFPADRLDVVFQRRAELEHFHADIFTHRTYARHGLTIESGDTVVDVGGNIGMFTLFAGAHRPTVRVLTFEPVPALARLIRANAALNGVDATVFEYGLAGADAVRTMTFYPDSSGMSSFYADADEERAVLRRVFENERAHGHADATAVAAYTDELIDARLRREVVEARTRRLSDVLHEQGIERVDYLKIDVQKAEAEVLAGIDDADWVNIRQIAIEVHDVDGRLAAITGELRRRGFAVDAEQDALFSGSIMWNVYARRPGPRPPRPLRVAPLAEPPPIVDALRGWLRARGAHDLAAIVALPGIPRAIDGTLDCAALPAVDLACDVERAPDRPRVAFMFAGLGDQYAGMARALDRDQPVFRDAIDRCARGFARHLGVDLRAALYPPVAAAPSAKLDLRAMLGRAPGNDTGNDAPAMRNTRIAQAAVFSVGYALAQMLIAHGLAPDAVIGHSLGEYVAAHVAGILELDDAIALVAARARVLGDLAPGAMLTVALGEADVAAYLEPGVSLAAVNAPEACTLSGEPDAIARVRARLDAAGIAARPLPADRAFHSWMMESALPEIVRMIGQLPLRAPAIPCISNVTGAWMTDAEAVDPAYWGRHLREAVRFADGARTLCREPMVLVELGAGQALGSFVRQAGLATLAIVPTLRAHYEADDGRLALEAITAAHQVARPAPAVEPPPVPVAPTNEVEAQLVDLWCDLLRRQRVGIHDNFFELGGQSLVGVQMLSRIGQRWGVRLTLRALFADPTVAGLALAIEDALITELENNPSPPQGSQ